MSSSISSVVEFTAGVQDAFLGRGRMKEEEEPEVFTSGVQDQAGSPVIMRPKH